MTKEEKVAHCFSGKNLYHEDGAVVTYALVAKVMVYGDGERVPLETFFKHVDLDEWSTEPPKPPIKVGDRFKDKTEILEVLKIYNGKAVFSYIDNDDEICGGDCSLSYLKTLERVE